MGPVGTWAPRWACESALLHVGASRGRSSPHPGRVRCHSYGPSSGPALPTPRYPHGLPVGHPGAATLETPGLPA
eukprot:533849-Rhodomonas_salina.1